MNSCEERNCRFWDGKQCNDPDEWINEQGEDCCRYHGGATVKTLSFSQLQAENKQQADFLSLAKEEMDALDKRLREDLLKYGSHLRDCELARQPFLSSTDSHWCCDCGFSQALDCKLCNYEGYVVNLKMDKGGYFTGHCPNCGKL